MTFTVRIGVRGSAAASLILYCLGVTDIDPQASAWALLDAYEGAALRARATASAKPLQNFLRTTLPFVLATVASSH